VALPPTRSPAAARPSDALLACRPGVHPWRTVPRRPNESVQHLETDFDTLPHHHGAEDIHLWPLLRERAADQGELLDEMEAQHEGIDPALDRVRSLGGAWAQRADEGTRDAFAEALDEMVGPLMAHLDQE
jgi:iron-sulfur cluster repair protein YtfE (RIC family)